MAKPALTGLRVRKLADRSSEERVTMVAVDERDVQREERDDGSVFLVIDPDRGERRLVNPATPGFDHEPWPFAGLEIVGEPPKRTRVATSWMQRGRAEGWLDVKGEQVVHKPGGPADDPWRVTHTFVHLDAVVLKTTGGDVRYRVTRQPDKYDGGPEAGTGKPTDAAGDGETSVDWFYELELEAS